LRETIESILKQTFKNYEVIIINDGSTDDTYKVLTPYLSDIRYFYQENSGGSSKHRNVGIKISSGRLISFFDSDDVMLEDKLDDYVKIFHKYPDVDLAFSDFSVIEEKGHVLKESALEKYKSFRKLLTLSDDKMVFFLSGEKLFTELLLANFIGTSSVVVRRSVF
jgi:glycosyltransferase involved in cell wall biosynthesis